ncbi:MAG: hypothetical protein K1X83_11120 [Oligoflexia bacterium]|nr:hypothetical protein [Oligoflexia bacterium]
MDDVFRSESPTPERTLGVSRVPASTLALDRTVSHLQKGGLPVNLETLSNVQVGLRSGQYRDNRIALARELKSDPALFTHYLKSLYASGADPQSLSDPLEALYSLEDEKLEKMFEISADSLSTHKLSKINRSQSLRLQHTLISTHTAEVLATKSEVAPGMAYSSAMLRQLALNLIAWNYPTIYGKALGAQRSRGGDLMQELQKQLGVSPLQIISRLMADWHLSAELRQSVAPESAPGLHRDVGPHEKMSAHEICELSELYARSHDRVNFPDAEAQWKRMEPALKDRFGSNFMEEIEHEILDSVVRYQHSAPAVFTAPYLAKVVPAIEPDSSDVAILRGNQFALRCAPLIRDALIRAYEKIEAGALSVEAIRELVDTVMPITGFSRGCLYLTSKDGTKLKPTLRLGDMPLSSYETLDHKEYHPIVDCLVATVPLKWNGVGIRGNQTEIVAGSLGALRHPGVLYLEIRKEAKEQPLEDVLICFHAIRKAFLDFLADGGE